MKKVIVDTNIIIDHTRGRSSLFQKLLTLQVADKLEIIIPSAVIMELFSGTETKNAKKLKNLEELLKLCQIAPLTYEVAKLAGFLTRDFPQVPDAIDFIVAATVLSQKGKLATANTKHYRAFKEIKFFKQEA